MPGSGNKITSRIIAKANQVGQYFGAKYSKGLTDLNSIVFYGLDKKITVKKYQCFRRYVLLVCQQPVSGLMY